MDDEKAAVLRVTHTSGRVERIGLGPGDKLVVRDLEGCERVRIELDGFASGAHPGVQEIVSAWAADMARAEALCALDHMRVEAERLLSVAGGSVDYMPKIATLRAEAQALDDQLTLMDKRLGKAQVEATTGAHRLEHIRGVLWDEVGTVAGETAESSAYRAVREIRRLRAVVETVADFRSALGREDSPGLLHDGTPCDCQACAWSEVERAVAAYEALEDGEHG